MAIVSAGCRSAAECPAPPSFISTEPAPPHRHPLEIRVAVAKDLLRRHDFRLDEVAERVGYGSASTFSTAFSRHVGQPPSRYARER